jgi:hypothetical protein
MRFVERLLKAFRNIIHFLQGPFGGPGFHRKTTTGKPDDAASL